MVFHSPVAAPAAAEPRDTGIFARFLKGKTGTRVPRHPFINSISTDNRHTAWNSTPLFLNAPQLVPWPSKPLGRISAPIANAAAGH
jgi:hypothetical protein